MTELPPELQALGHFVPEPVAQAVGLCTGRVVAGPVGAHGMLSYTVHGSAVNLAARLEQLNKDYGTRIRGHAEHVTLYTPAELHGRGRVRSLEAQAAAAP